LTTKDTKKIKNQMLKLPIIRRLGRHTAAKTCFELRMTDVDFFVSIVLFVDDGFFMRNIKFI